MLLLKFPLARAAGLSDLIEQLIGFQSEELLQALAGHKFIKELGGRAKLTSLETFVAPFAADALQFLSDQFANHWQRDLAPILKDAPSVVHPLPDLRAGDLRGGRVLHQIVER